MTAPSIVVVGELMLDVVLPGATPGEVPGNSAGAERLVRAGGSAATVALAFRRAEPEAGQRTTGPERTPLGTGRRATIIGKTGDDPVGRWLRGRLEHEHVVVRPEPAPDAPTGYVIMRRTGGADRVVYTERGANRRLTVADVPAAALDQALWLHVSGYTLLEPGPAEVARTLAGQAKRLGLPVSLDLGVPRAFGGRSPGDLVSLFRLGLDGGPDYLFASRSMAERLAGPGRDPAPPAPTGLAAALERLFPARVVVITQGSEGVLVGGREVRPPAGLAPAGADVSGAGDVFVGRFISGVLDGLRARDSAEAAVREAAWYVAAALSGIRGGEAGAWRRVASPEPPVLASACLLGVQAAYDGRPKSGSGVPGWLFAPPDERLVLPVCPEAAGGLAVPRQPAEIRAAAAARAVPPGGPSGAPGPTEAATSGGDAVLDGRASVVGRDGEDLTAAFLRGAKRVTDLAQACGATLAVLKEASPSCGASQVHDGTFSGRRIPGRGVTAAALRRAGVEVLSSGHP